MSAIVEIVSTRCHLNGMALGGLHASSQRRLSWRVRTFARLYGMPWIVLLAWSLAVTSLLLGLLRHTARPRRWEFACVVDARDTRCLGRGNDEVESPLLKTLDFRW